MNTNLRSVDTISPSVTAAIPQLYVERGSLPFGATYRISTNPALAVSMSNARGRKYNQRSATEVQIDPETTQPFVPCKGLTFTRARTSIEFDKSVKFLRSKRETPRDKGAIVIPQEFRFRVDPDFLRALADEGIVVMRTKMAKLDDAMIDFALEFIRRTSESYKNMESFMADSSSK